MSAFCECYSALRCCPSIQSTLIALAALLTLTCGRVAIKGWLPHGPPNVRAILATHILKRKGSYEQASTRSRTRRMSCSSTMAVSCPPLVAKILNQVWEVA
jgi:hypothetical protein